MGFLTVNNPKTSEKLIQSNKRQTFKNIQRKIIPFANFDSLLPVLSQSLQLTEYFVLDVTFTIFHTLFFIPQVLYPSTDFVGFCTFIFFLSFSFYDHYPMTTTFIVRFPLLLPNPNLALNVQSPQILLAILAGY